MPRLTRQESKARTRAALVDTARTLFLTEGFQQTSLERVAEEAGFSKGAVYSNFRSKEELCLAVLDEIQQREYADLLAVVAPQADFESKLLAMQAWAERILGSPSWTVLGTEAIAAAHTRPQLRAQLAQRDAAFCHIVARLLTAEADAGTISLALPAEDLAPILLAVGTGLGLQRSVNPDAKPGLLIDAARALVRPVRPEGPH